MSRERKAEAAKFLLPPFEVRPLGPHIGVAIEGLDLGTPIDEATGDRLRALLAEYHLLVFHAPALEPEQQLRLGAVFGEPVDEGGDGRRYVHLSNAREGGVLAHGRRLLFHSDNVFTPAPLSVISLYMERLEGENAPTCFANAARAAAGLESARCDELAGASALFLSGFAGGHLRYRDAEVEPQHPRAIHPVLPLHPRTGRPVLLVSEQQTDRILDWVPERSESTLQQLFAALYAPDNVYVHVWREGDLCLWDNLALQHGRPALGAGERTLRRVAMVDGNAEAQRAWTRVSRDAEERERGAT